VDWDVIGGTMKQVSLSRQIWISKHVTGFCATGNKSGGQYRQVLHSPS
jgi:hypothetical protein